MIITYHGESFVKIQHGDLMVALNPKGINQVRIGGKDPFVIDGPGEYEVGGLKISANSSLDSGIFYGLNVDSTQAILAKTSTIEKLQDMANEAQVAILNVDSLLNEAIIAQLEAKVIVLYGERASEGLKALGKQDLSPSKKITVAREKLPQEGETQIIWLG